MQFFNLVFKVDRHLVVELWATQNVIRTVRTVRTILLLIGRHLLLGCFNTQLDRVLPEYVVLVAVLAAFLLHILVIFFYLERWVFDLRLVSIFPIIEVIYL